MAQPQRQADVHQNELCPPNKRYALMDANKNIDLDNLLCLNESQIMANILQNHPLKFSIAASSSVPYIYLGKFWHTLKEDESKYKLKFVLDRKELTVTLDDFRKIFQLPQATNNNHECFGATPKFLEMVPFFVNGLGFTLELRSPSNFKTTGLVQPWQILCKMFSRWKNKAGVGMKIPSWMMTDEMKLTENYWMYAAVFRIDIPTNQSQSIESTQGTNRTTSAPTTPNPDVDEEESKTIQLSIAEQKSHDDFEAKQNEEKVKEHLMAKEIEKLVEGTENVENNKGVNSVLNNQEVLGTRLEPMSNKESLEVEITAAIQPVNVNVEEEESAEDDYELRRREKGKHVEETRNTPSTTTIRSPRTHSTLISSDTEKLQELTITDLIPSSSTPSLSSTKPTLSMMLRLFVWTSKDKDDPHDDAHPEGENNAKRKKMTVHGTYVFGESSSGQANESKPGPSTSGNQEQLDDFNIWTNTYATNDDELPTKKVSQELVEEMSQTVDEAKLRKVVNEILRQ
ncbi:hypothetical protein Tco_0536734 [Tanacetum coccineum]